jgi:DNA-directed RNA polymerase subunit RPC12/RpoP
MPETTPHIVDRMTEEAKSKKRRVAPLMVKGRAMRCPICGHEFFWERKVLLNSRAMTFFGLDWANRESRAMVCDDCGHILFFAQ